MAMFSTSRYFSFLHLLIFCFRILNAGPEQPNKSFSFKNFGTDSKFESELALHGDAKVVNGGGGVSIQVSGSMVNSAGRVMYKKPFRLFEGKPRKVVSFSMHVVFSMSSENGDGLVFMMVPAGFPLDVFNGCSFGLLGDRRHRFLAVEFDTLKDDKYGDVNDNHVGVDVGSFVSVKSNNVSLVHMVLNSGKKLQAWIDYEASSRRLELRLSKLGENKPVDPLLYCPIDLSQIWKGGEVLVGLSASSRNSTQKCNVYSWSFSLWSPPHWMHSEPLDPNTYLEKSQDLNNDNNNNDNLHKKSDCALRVLAALIFGTGCGALGALIVLFIWTILGYRRPVVPEDYALSTKDQVDQNKLQKIVVDKAIEDGKK